MKLGDKDMKKCVGCVESLPEKSIYLRFDDWFDGIQYLVSEFIRVLLCELTKNKTQERLLLC